MSRQSRLMASTAGDSSKGRKPLMTLQRTGEPGFAPASSPPIASKFSVSVISIPSPAFGSSSSQAFGPGG